MWGKVAMAVLLGLTMSSQSHAVETVRVAAAGSLRQSMQEIAASFRESKGIPVTLEFGASGMLKDKIARQGSIHVFASANLEHPAELARTGTAAPAVVFARNRLCALARPGLKVSTETLLSVLLDPEIKLGTSTPKSDPSGDYAWEVFQKAEALRPGARAVLEQKALQLTGGPKSPPPPADRSVYGKLLAEHQADVMLIYCTNARQASSEVSGLQVIELPNSLAVGADYGLTVLDGSPPAAYVFALFVLSPVGQSILAKYGFVAPTAPARP
jgi:molybdate transport system substrate-binding protein